MEVYEAIRGRRSIRSFTSAKVPKKILDEILDAGRWAPSAGNVQARQFMVVSKEKTKINIADASNGQWFISKAPVVIAVCADYIIQAMYGDRGRNLYVIMDCAASVQNMMLAAHALGLGSCWVSSFDDAKVRKILKLDNRLAAVALIALGYPAETPEAPQRRPLKELVKYA
ncbi:MAG: nitroreductase family protein [Candidatus Micrarchaeota archaeon]